MREAILPLIELHPCTSALEGAAMGEPLPAAATACSALCRNANIRLFEEKHNLGRNTEEQPWIPVRAAGYFYWLVPPRGLRSPRSSKMRTFRNRLWYHRHYQQALGNCRTQKKLFWTTPAWSDVWSQRRICRANVHEATRQTVGADNHRSPVQSSCISKLKMER